MAKPVGIRLFYSYSHADSAHQDDMEKALSLLRQDGLLQDWSDRKILPGQSISASIQSELDAADIICFLLSHDYIASEACMSEWRYANARAQRHRHVSRIPIILADCSWKDLLRQDDIKALPKDGTPVVSYEHKSKAWQEVYEGLKEVIELQRRNFAPRPDHIKDMEATDLVSQDDIALSDIFVFPSLVHFRPDPAGAHVFEDRIKSVEDILALQRCIIHGDEMSGKSALARHIFLSLTKLSEPVMLIDLREERRRPTLDALKDLYRSQFAGDFDLWKSQPNKTVVFDNLTASRRSIDYVVFAMDFFQRVVVTTSSDVFLSFYKDEDRLASFKEVKLRPLSHVQQEELIRARLSKMESVELTDGLVDEVERRVNAVITNGLVPRYPFYVLSAVQTFEAFMPTAFSVTSYGHCYYVMILARLTRSGMSSRDKDINACLNFAEHLALETYERTTGDRRELEEHEFAAFVQRYDDMFVINPPILNRLQHPQYGIITKTGTFRVKYMLHYFLGMCLSKSRADDRRMKIVDEMCENSHTPFNHLTLMFTIHHATDNLVLEKVLSETEKTLKEIDPAKLDRVETGRFGEIVSALEERVLSESSVDAERKKERVRRDIAEANEEQGEEEVEVVNDCYRILKNNRILGQVLRNRFGSLEKDRLAGLVNAIADGGLRLVNLLLKDETEIENWATFLSEANDELSLEEVKRVVRLVSFHWTMLNIESVVRTIGFAEIREIVENVVKRVGTPAYEMIGYFASLDGAAEMTPDVVRQLKRLLAKHQDGFVKGVLSVRTQHYINTHRSPVNVEQSVCAVLGIRYRHRLMEARRRG